ncbi:MAG: hypothetical protein ABI813_02340, partial [Bacteroidota bacterium]
QGPHLHFEIRTTNEDVNKNPVLFGFPLADNTKPVIRRLALYDRRLSLYEQSPKLIPIKKTAVDYSTTSPVILVTSPKISFAISTTDNQTGSFNQNGIFEVGIYDNDKPVIGFRMDNIGYDNTRDINAHIDYKTRANGGPFLQQLFELPGYLNSIYKKVGGDGAIDISDGTVHNIKIYVKDGYNNTSLLFTRVQYTGNPSALPVFAGKKFYPLMLDGFEDTDCEFYIGERCLYDSVHIAYKKVPATTANAVSAVYGIGAAWIPLKDSMIVRIKTTVFLDAGKKSHVVMQRFAGAKQDVEKVVWQKDWATAKFREMGNFQLVLDETPPVIVPIGFNDGANMSRASRIVLVINDNLQTFKNFRAELDGKWLRFTNDKGKSFIYNFDEKCVAGPHSLKISVEDEAGNFTTKTFLFTR